MKGLNTVKLGNIAKKITKGTTPTTLGLSFAKNGINYIKAESIDRQGFIDKDKFVFIDKKTNDVLKRSIIYKDDLLFTIAGVYLGKIAIVKKEHLPANTNQAVAIIRLKKEVILPKYLKYFFLNKSFNRYINSLCAQAAQPNINLSQLSNLEILLPPLSRQKKITAVLSTYDDLIENNNRRIAILEKMAEEIYREWFVRMRFPGHEKVKFRKGVPEGWENEQIINAFEFTGGGTPSKNIQRYWEKGTINWYTPTDITSANGIFLFESSLKCNEEGLNKSSARIFPPYSIMMTSRATIGALGVNTTFACTNQGFITCIPNEQYPLCYLYHWLKLNKPYFEILSSGATFSELIKSTFKKIFIIKPPKELIDRFQKIVKPIFTEIEVFSKSVLLLTQSRDLLLPRLISGKLSVEDLDIQFPPGMEEEDA